MQSGWYELCCAAVECVDEDPQNEYEFKLNNNISTDDQPYARILNAPTVASPLDIATTENWSLFLTHFRGAVAFIWFL